MTDIRVHFEDGNTITTSINGARAEIEAYYVGKAFQFGDTEECPRDNMAKAVRVEFLDNCPLETGLRPCMCNMPRCPVCNYTAHDATFEGDHRLCKGTIPS